MTIESMLSDAQLAIEGALEHPEILRRLSRYSYDRKKLMEGKALYEKAVMLYEAQRQEYCGKEKARDVMKQARQQLEEVYNRHFKIAKVVLVDRPIFWKAMQMQGPRQRAYFAWIKQVKAFYRNIKKVSDIMAKYGVGSDEIEQAKAMMKALSEARMHFNLGQSDAQRATEIRDATFQELRGWVGDFKKIASVVLKKEGQLLEAIGVVVAS